MAEERLTNGFWARIIFPQGNRIVTTIFEIKPAAFFTSLLEQQLIKVGFSFLNIGNFFLPLSRYRLLLRGAPSLARPPFASAINRKVLFSDRLAHNFNCSGR